MVSVRLAAKHPQVVSTNRHIMQGMMECHKICWDADRHALTGRVDVVGGEDFVLTLACNGHAPRQCEGAAVRKRPGERGLIDLVFASPKNARKRFEVFFDKGVC